MQIGVPLHPPVHLANTQLKWALEEVVTKDRDLSHAYDQVVTGEDQAWILEDVGAAAPRSGVRSTLERLTPEHALAEQKKGALLIDVRTAASHAGAAGIPGAVVIDLAVLPRRLDPTLDDRIAEANSWDNRYILFCEHGTSSFLAAANLRQMGLHRATALSGGFAAWAQAGYTTVHGPADVRA